MLFKYKVKFWEDFEDKNETGLVVGKTYVEACEKVVGYYGHDALIDITLEPWESFLTFDEIIEGLKL